jgi:hypothetical protein
MVVNLSYVKESIENIIIGIGYEESRKELYDKIYFSYLENFYSKEWRKMKMDGKFF